MREPEAGVWLHVTEHHEHDHVHEPLLQRILTRMMNTIGINMSSIAMARSPTLTSASMVSCGTVTHFPDIHHRHGHRHG